MLLSMIQNFALSESVPGFGKAVLNALQFSDRNLFGSQSLKTDDWAKLLAFCDAAQLTFNFFNLYQSEIPDWVAVRVARNRRDAAIRQSHLDAALTEIVRRFKAAEIDFALLKGHAHSQEFGPDMLLRATSDVDLWCKPEEVGRARNELLKLGYRSMGNDHGRHLAPMIREKDWRWSGDFYAPDLPLPIELHHRLWDEEMESIQGPPEDAFWGRRSYLNFEGETISILALPDALAFSALHLLMHILHGDLRPQRAWEIGQFLQRRSRDDCFWHEWANLHPPELRKLESLIFVLIDKWFGCTLPQIVQREAETLAPDVKTWIERYGFSPVEALFASNKTELWLNLCLISSLRGKIQLFVRRMLPIHGSKTVSFGEGGAPRSILLRATHHVRTFGPTLAEGLEWWRIRHARNKSHGRQPASQH